MLGSSLEMNALITYVKQRKDRCNINPPRSNIFVKISQTDKNKFIKIRRLPGFLWKSKKTISKPNLEAIVSKNFGGPFFNQLHDLRSDSTFKKSFLNVLMESIFRFLCVFISKCMKKRTLSIMFYSLSAGYNQGWKYRLVIDNRYYSLCFSVIDCRTCFAFNAFYRLSPFLCFLLTVYRLVESLNFTFVFVESAWAFIVSLMLYCSL